MSDTRKPRLSSYFEKEISNFGDYRVVQEKQNIVFVEVASGQSRLFMKCFDDAEGYQSALSEFDALNVYRPHFSIQSCYDVPCPRACLSAGSGQGILVTDYVPLARGDRWFNWFSKFPSLRSAGVRRAANWLALFHRASEPCLRSTGDFLQKVLLDEKVATYAQRESLEPYQLQGYRQAFDRAVEQPSLHGIIHSDFTPSNIFITRRSVVGFDFTLKRTDFLYQDIVNFIVAMIWPSRRYGNQLHARSIDRDISTFIQCFGNKGIDLDVDVLKLFLINRLFEKIESIKGRTHTGSKARTNARHVKLLDAALLSTLCSFSSAGDA